MDDEQPPPPTQHQAAFVADMHTSSLTSLKNTGSNGAMSKRGKQWTNTKHTKLAGALDAKAEIKKIHAENEELKQELAREARQARLTKAMTSCRGGEMQRLQAEADGYLRKIEAEQAKISEIDQKITDANRHIAELRQKTGGANASKHNHEMLTKQIRILENRLAKALQKFNEQNAANKQVRDQIDELRRERVVYDGIYKKLEKELHAKKKEMAAIIEDSKRAYQKSDKARSELATIKAQLAKEKEEFQREWAELGRLMEQERLEREQLRHRTSRRRSADAEILKRADPMSGLPLGTSAEMSQVLATPAAVEQGNERAKSAEGADDDAAPEQHASLHPMTSEQIDSYEQIFAKVKAETGVESIKELVDHFQDIEQKNFSLFNSINELNCDIEQSELSIAETKLEIEKYKGQGVSTDTQRKKVLRNLEEKLARTEAKADEYELKHQNAQKTINQLKTGIHSIFSRLGCASTSVEEMLGNQGVTESNMMQYLEIIEQRTTEILHNYAQSQAASTGKLDLVQTSALEQGILQPATARLSIQPPAWDDFSSGDESDQEDDERPLTRDELQRKTLRGFGLKDNKAAAAGSGSAAAVQGHQPASLQAANKIKQSHHQGQPRPNLAVASAKA